MADVPLFTIERPPTGDGLDLVVVAVHGTMDRSASFAKVLRRLGEVRTLAYDRRGYGRSRNVSPAPDLDASVADLVGLCDGRPAVVAGHSYGGCIALRAAEIAPDAVRAVAVFEPPLPWLVDWPADTGSGRALCAPDAGAAAEAFLRRMIGNRRWDDLPERAKADRRAEGPALVADLRSVRPAPGEAPPLDPTSIGVPVLVARGTTSPPHLLSGADRLAGLLPHGELTAVDGADHGIHLSHPEAFAALIRHALHRAS